MGRYLDQSPLVVDARYEMLFQLGVKSNKALWMAYMATVLRVLLEGQAVLLSRAAWLFGLGRND
ncbi:MAG: hypothetical protein A2Y50_05995 [Pseudomonadales bacterium RIFCSPLOWO2_12_59_9]|nr:MAG: hypothetical protein A2Y50_05995 [Pseudomonadales bacterium RIFCSPLOWO2_12_59_9]